MSLPIEERVARFSRRAADLYQRVQSASIDRDLAGREADMLVEIGRGMIPEVKAAGPALEARLRDALKIVYLCRP